MKRSVDNNIKGRWFFKKETSKTPFGMTMPGRSYNAHTSRHGFTGHEKESDLAEGIYTTEYRLYDAQVGRWLSVDPLFEKYVGMSPYNYCMLNPLMMVDPDGRDVRNCYKNEYQILEKDSAADYSDLLFEIHPYLENRILSLETERNTFYHVAKQYDYEHDENVLHIGGHGLFKGEFVILSVDIIGIYTQNSVQRLSQDLGGDNTYKSIVLHICQSGKDDKSIASFLSKEMPNTYIVAPSTDVNYQLLVNDISCDIKEAREQLDDEGVWNIYSGGKVITTLSGNIIPIGENINNAIRNALPKHTNE